MSMKMLRSMKMPWSLIGARVFGNAQISGNVHVSGNTHVSGNARLEYIPIDFDCGFDPYKALKEILNYPKILPTLLGLNKNLNKLISTILTKTGT